MLIAGSPYDKCTNYTVVVFVMCRCTMFMLEFLIFVLVHWFLEILILFVASVWGYMHSHMWLNTQIGKKNPKSVNSEISKFLVCKCFTLVLSTLWESTQWAINQLLFNKCLIVWMKRATFMDSTADSSLRSALQSLTLSGTWTSCLPAAVLVALNVAADLQSSMVAVCPPDWKDPLSQSSWTSRQRNMVLGTELQQWCTWAGSHLLVRWLLYICGTYQNWAGLVCSDGCVLNILTALSQCDTNISE